VFGQWPRRPRQQQQLLLLLLLPVQAIT